MKFGLNGIKLELQLQGIGDRRGTKCCMKLEEKDNSMGQGLVESAE